LRLSFAAAIAASQLPVCLLREGDCRSIILPGPHAVLGEDMVLCDPFERFF
jgi:hypothetical protein